jgi:CBS domain-containing protein
MIVAEILNYKGSTLYTIAPGQPLIEAAQTMSKFDMGSLVVIDKGAVCGILTFREVMAAMVANDGQLGELRVDSAMDPRPLTCSPQTMVEDVRKMMIGKHARYMPVVESGVLMGVISLYDVAKAVVAGHERENRQLKAYIFDQPSVGLESSSVLG